MRDYLDIVEKVLKEGVKKENRTGVDTIAIAGAQFQHDMANGFPLLTTKRMYIRGIKVELEGFIKGVTDKKWFQDRKCTIWDEWCDRSIVPYAHDEESKVRMKEERDLGPIYGWQWRHFGADYEGYDHDYAGEGVDQLEEVVEKLKTDSSDRRMLVTAWNPRDKDRMSIPPCHYGFHITVIGDRLNLTWDQRSVDVALGLPFNIASYGILLHLLAKESGFREGMLTGHLKDVHIYENHLKEIAKQLGRTPLVLPEIETRDFNSIFDWEHNHTTFKGYKSHSKISFDIAV